MTFLKRLSILVLTLAIVLPAAAQFRFGPRVGVCLNSLSMDKSTLDAENRAGFTGGLQAEFTIPVIGLGFDLSVMYVNRSSKFIEGNQTTNVSSDYIEIPLNLKYKIGLPIVGKIVSPYLFTGPSVAFLTSKSAISEFAKSKKCDWSWNFGLGVQLFSHLQVSASYGLGLTKAVEFTNIGGEAAGIEGKNKYWTVTAAWLF